MQLATEDRIGSGARTTVLLHGFLGSGKNLRTLALRWAERAPHRTFLLPDLRGHGRSPPLEDDTTLRTLAADVLETVQAQGLSFPIDVVGHSLGGRVALAGTLDAPEKLGSVVLLDISPSPVPKLRLDSGAVLEILLRAPDRAPDRPTLRNWFLEQSLSASLTDWLLMNLERTSDGEYVWTFDRKALKDLHERVNPVDLWPAVERPGANVRCIRGALSRYVSDEDADRMVRAGCPVDTVDAGHYVHVETLQPLLDLLNR